MYKRQLYVLANTSPASVFVELGNIQNTFDQRRFVISSNRQALAKWMMEEMCIRDRPNIYSFHHEVKIIPPWWNDFYSMEERILVRCPAPKLLSIFKAFCRVKLRIIKISQHCFQTIICLVIHIDLLFFDNML